MTSFATDATIAATPLASLTYPRTGKRGVPQQFPRRLYEMLESEAKLANTDPDHQDIIAWSDSGKAFRIVNVTLFASHVLPKYFRTSKFSSFQRNLNLVSLLVGFLFFLIFAMLGSHKTLGLIAFRIQFFLVMFF